MVLLIKNNGQFKEYEGIIDILSVIYVVLTVVTAPYLEERIITILFASFTFVFVLIHNNINLLEKLYVVLYVLLAMNVIIFVYLILVNPPHIRILSIIFIALLINVIGFIHYYGKIYNQLMIKKKDSPSLNVSFNGQYSSISNGNMNLRDFTETESITANGTYLITNSNHGFRSVNVEVPTRDYKSIVKNINENGVYKASDDNADGYSKAIVNVESVNNADVTTNNIITRNDVYNIPSGYTGFNSFRVDVESIKNVNVTTNNIITRNDVYNIPSGYTGFNSFRVDVESVKNVDVTTNNIITRNDVYNIPSGYTGFNSFRVDVESVKNADVTTNNIITSNAVYNIPSGYTGFNSFRVDVESVKNVNVTTNNIITSNAVYTIPSGYTGFNSFTVDVPMKKPKVITHWKTSYNSTLYAFSSGSPVSGSVYLPKGYGSGNYTQLVYDTTRNLIASVYSAGSNSSDLILDSGNWKLMSPQFGNSPVYNYKIDLCDSSGNILMSIPNVGTRNMNVVVVYIELNQCDITF